ncbi:MAG: NupC/NupG family nucleoside CNT transporter [bacterium]
MHVRNILPVMLFCLSASLFSQQASLAQEAKKEAPAKAAETQPAVNPADNPGGEVAKAATPASAPAVPSAAAQPVPLSDRLRSLFGVVLILGVCYAFSSNRKIISRRIVFWGLTLQWIMAYLVLSNPYGQNALKWTGSQIEKVLACSYKGSEFLFGAEAINPAGKIGFVFAFRVLPTVIFMSALFAVLYYLKVMPFIVARMAWVMKRLLGVSGAESLAAAANVFLGQTEAPLTIRPFLNKLTQSELLVVMATGMASVSGGMMGAYFAYGIASQHILTAVMMTAPGCIMICKMLVPETEEPETLGYLHHEALNLDTNLLDAASRGTREGLDLALNIGAMLISFISLITLLNLLLGGIGEGINGSFSTNMNLSLQSILGFILAPFAWLMGVPWAESAEFGSLLGTRTIVNELIAYDGLAKLKTTFHPRTFAMASFALCGFANLSSIGIQLGGIGAIVPERRKDLAKMGLKAMVAGSLANYMSACIAGILL